MPESRAEAKTPRPTFFRITIGLLVLLSLAGVAIIAFLALNVAEINRSGGWGWIVGAAVGIT